MLRRACNTSPRAARHSEVAKTLKLKYLAQSLVRVVVVLLLSALAGNVNGFGLRYLKSDTQFHVPLDE